MCWVGGSPALTVVLVILAPLERFGRRQSVFCVFVCVGGEGSQRIKGGREVSMKAGECNV